jgi:hypothetical protein
MFKLLGRRERSVGCCGHIYFFTTQTLKNLYEAAGFKTVKLNYVGRSLTLERLNYNLGVITKNPNVRARLDAFAHRFHINKASLYLNFRDMQRVCVQKVAHATSATETVPAAVAVAS